MRRGYFRGFTASEKTELWDRWQRGESLKAIGRAFGKPSSSIYFQLAPHGGIRPPPRRRARLALTLAEREEISRAIALDQSARSIARLLGRSPSSVSREISRNGGYDRYRAAPADEQAWNRARRPKRCKLATNSRLRRSVRRSRQVGLHKDRRGQITGLISIRERPAAIEDRAVPGHWEGDLLSGSKNSYIATLVERHTRYVMLAKVVNKDTQTIVSALIKQAKMLPNELYKSLTWDRGKELADHRRFTLATNIDVYFCDPQSPWQRGSNENTNGLLRQYFPKGADLSVYSQAHLNKVARQLNERPRKTLGFETPAEKFNACVASTG